MADDDAEQFGQLIPPTHSRKVGERYNESRALEREAGMFDPGWGLANTVATLRHRSAARLMKARTKHAETWRRFLEELVLLGEALIERERMRRRLQNLDAILDEEEIHTAWLERIRRQCEIEQAQETLNQAKKRRRDSERALEPEKEKPEPKEPKEEKKKASDPTDRIVEGFERRQYLKQKRDDLIQRVLDAAKAQGLSPDDDEIQREIGNIKSDFNKAIADVYGR